MVLVRVLGSVGIADSDGRYSSGPAKQSCILAALALNPRQPVTMNELIAMVWNDDPPVSAPNVVYGHIMRLRRILDGRAEIRHSRDEGYVLDIDPRQVDLHVAREAATVAARGTESGDAARAVELWREACDWWREPVLPGVDSDWARRVRESLRREQVAVYAGRFEVELTLGRHAAVVRELESLVSQHPTAEELAAQLMLALYRCGRAAEALDCYEGVRVRLRDRLGTAPAQRLQSLHRQVLRHDPALGWTAAAEPEVPVTAAETVPVPAQLPVDTAAFTGRGWQLEALLDEGKRSTDTPTVAIVDGMAGVGKTTLVVHAAHRLADRFPDGQLFLDLHGHTENMPPVEPADALDRLLRALGVPPRSIPDNVEDRAAAFRSIMADKRILMILDNAASHRQVRPLLPAGRGNHVLITSRRNLSEIDDAEAVNLDTLPADEARLLFCQAAKLSAPDADTRRAVEAIVASCGRLPLALRIAAARLTSRKHWTVEELRDRLVDAADPLRQLVAGQRSVIAAFDVSFRELDDEARRAFRLLGMLPGSDFGIHAAAAILRRDITDTEILLERLTDDHLLSAGPGGRYSFHDLLRQYAIAAADSEESSQQRLTAIQRAIDMYCAAAGEAARLADTLAFHPPAPAADGSPAIPQMPDSAAAIAWWHREWRNVADALVCAIEYELDSQAFQAVTTLWAYFHLFGDMDRMSAISLRALRAAEKRQGSVIESWMLTFRGLSLFRLGSLEEAERHFVRSLGIRTAHEDVRGQAILQHNIARCQQSTGRFEAAAAKFAESRRLFDVSGNPLNAISSSMDSALAYARIGKLTRALRDLDEAEAWLAAHGSDMTRSWVPVYRGLVHLERGDLDAAAREFATDWVQENPDSEYQVARQLGLARIACGTGDHVAALAHCEAAIELCRQRQRFSEPEARNVMGGILRDCGRTDEAWEHYTAAAKQAEAFGAIYESARAYHGMAEMSAERGEPDAEQRHLETAYRHYNACGTAEAATIRARLDALGAALRPKWSSAVTR